MRVRVRARARVRGEAQAYLMHTATMMPPMDWVSTTDHVTRSKPCNSPWVGVRVGLEQPLLARDRAGSPNRNPKPKPKPKPKPNQVWGEAVTEEMVLDEQMLRGLVASEARGTNGPKELL